RRLRELQSPFLRIALPRILQPTNQVRYHSAHMGVDHFELGVALENAVKDQADHSHGRVERVAVELIRDLHHVQDLVSQRDSGMHEDRHVVVRRHLEYWREFLEKQWFSLDVGEHLDSLKSELLLAARQFLAGLVDVLIRKAGVGVEAMRVLLCRFGQSVIDALGPIHALVSFQHIWTWYGLAHDLRVHPSLVEVGDAGSEVIMAWPVDMRDDDVAGLHYVRM